MNLTRRQLRHLSAGCFSAGHCPKRVAAAWIVSIATLFLAAAMIGCGTPQTIKCYGRVGIYRVTTESRPTDEHSLAVVIGAALKEMGYHQAFEDAYLWREGSSTVRFSQDDQPEFLLEFRAFGSKEGIIVSEETENHIVQVLESKGGVELKPVSPTASLPAPNERTFPLLPITSAIPDRRALKYVNINSGKTSKTSLYDLLLKAKADLKSKGVDVAPIEHSVAFEIVGERDFYLEISFLAPPGSPSFGVVFNRRLEIVNYKFSKH